MRRSMSSTIRLKNLGLLLAALLATVTTASVPEQNGTRQRERKVQGTEPAINLEQGQQPATPQQQQQQQQQQSVLETTNNNNEVVWCGHDFLCYHGAQCVDGPPNFDDHLLPDGTVLEIHQVDELMTMHCECPPEWTGVQCQIPVANCEGVDHYCYNGGKCIAGLQNVHDDNQLFCDCSLAFDKGDNHYVGKNCEQKVEEFCDEAKTNFCLNDGTCNSEYPWHGEPCKCPDGFQGAHCEYKVAQVPDCNLPCQHGACMLGVHPDGALASKQESPFQFCSCADNWAGEYCEIEAVPCGDRSCYHGSVCVQRVVDNEEVFHCDCGPTDTGTTAYAGRYCEFKATSFCLPGNDNTNGVGGGGASDSSSVNNLNGDLFCVNEGICREDPYMGCLCLPGFSGFSCEFRVAGGVPASQPTDPSSTGTTGIPAAPVENTICTLDCGEHGVCRNGIKDNTALGDAAHAAHLNETDDGSFQHCICQDGYVGLLCDHVVEVCPDGQRKCLHGSTCYQEGQEYLCDCQNIPSPPTTDTNGGNSASSYAGDSCEHPSTSTCLLDPQNGPAKPLSFCVNYGTCKQMVGPNDAHQGCICTPGWSGPHCEIRDHATTPAQPVPPPAQAAPVPPPPVAQPTAPQAAQPVPTPANPTPEHPEEPVRQPAAFVPNRSGTSSSNSESKKVNRQVAGVVVTAILLFVACITAFICCRAHGKRIKYKKNEDIGRAVEWSDGRYRDNPPEQVNLAPRRASAYVEAADRQALNGNHDQDDDVYMASIASPSRDPMATMLAPAPSEPDDNEAEEGPQVYIGPPRDEDGHVLHSVEII